MFNFQIAQIGKDKGFWKFVQKLTGGTDVVKEIEKRAKEREKRQWIRVYIELPVRLEIQMQDGRKETFEGKSTNLSESGLLVNFWIRDQIWKLLESNIDSVRLYYRFPRPKAISGDMIEGSIMRHVKKINRRNQLIELELGIHNINIGSQEKDKITGFVNRHVKDSIEEDLLNIKKIKEARNLSELEEKMYQFLMKERNQYNDESDKKGHKNPDQAKPL
ncbi:hypothetical protein ACFL67_02780 [candidate division KSB1 bacterium]